jgi:hypothetical protein
MGWISHSSPELAFHAFTEPSIAAVNMTVPFDAADFAVDSAAIAAREFPTGSFTGLATAGAAKQDVIAVTGDVCAWMVSL